MREVLERKNSSPISAVIIVAGALIKALATLLLMAWSP